MFAPITQEPRAQTLNNSNRTTTIGSRYAALSRRIVAKADTHQSSKQYYRGLIAMRCSYPYGLFNFAGSFLNGLSSFL